MRNKKSFKMAKIMESFSLSSASKKVQAPLKKGLAPWVGENPYVLILGTLPSDVSIQAQAYYQNKSHNSFYKIMENLFKRIPGQSDKEFIISNHIALWDCMKTANREGNLDVNIKNDTPNEIEEFLHSYPTISTIVLNGGRAETAFRKSFFTLMADEKLNVKPLISTSNAASRVFEEKLEEWRIVKDIIDASNEVHKG